MLQTKKRKVMKGLLIVGVLLMSASAFSQDKQKDKNYYKNTIVGRMEMREMSQKQQQQNNLHGDKHNSRVYIKDKRQISPKRIEK